MVYTEVIAAAINYDLAAGRASHPAVGQQPDHGAAAVRWAGLAEQLERRQAALENRRARAEAFQAVADAIRDPARLDTGTDAQHQGADNDAATAAAAQRRRLEQERREQKRRREQRPTEGPAQRPSLR